MLQASRIDEARRRGGEVPALIDQFKAAEARRKELQGSLDALRAERNAANQRMAQTDKKSAAFAEARDALRELSQRIKAGEAELAEVGERCAALHLTIPNAPHESVPEGADETANRQEALWGEQPRFDFEPRAHWDIGEGLGILDFQSAAKISGARFCVLRGAGAQLSRALASYMIDLHVARGYTEVQPPVLVRRHTMEGTGQLPKFEDEAFKTAGEQEYFLIPTAEVPVTNLHRDEILEAAQLPLWYTAFTPCFRAEAGSYGKDTRGLIRQHQFDKVELVKLTTPETSYQELESLREAAEAVLRGLGLAYRVMNLCGGDMGFAAAKTYDLEVWLPGQGAYREISSCSNCEDFQARRAKIRYRPGPGEKPRLVHTLNGSGLAVGRTLVAVLENYQQADGSVQIPEVLRPYMGGRDRIGPERG